MRSRLRGLGASWHSLIMAFHHVALATRDLDATHRFYTEAMGFTLVKVVVGADRRTGGWAKHLFYDTGGDGLIAFWDLHDDAIGDDFDPPHLHRPGPARRGSTTWPSTPPTLDDLEAPAASTGSTRASTSSRSTTGGACRSTPPTPTASSSSSAPTPGRSPTTDRAEAAPRCSADPTPAAARPRPSRRSTRQRRRSRRGRPRRRPGRSSGYWPDPGDDPAVDARPRAGRARQPRRRRRPRDPLDAARRARWRTAVVLTHPRGDFSGPLRVPAARRRRVRGARLRHPLRQQRHRLPARDAAWSTSRPRSPRCGGAAPRPSCCSATAAAARSWRWPRRPRWRRPTLGDAFVALAAHPGEGVFMLQVIDPSVTDEADPFSVDPALDMYDPANGWRPWPEPSLLRPRPGWPATAPRSATGSPASTPSPAPRSPTAPTARDAARAVDRARPEWNRLRRRAVHARYLTIYRTLADPAYLDLSIDPDDRAARDRSSPSPTRSTPTTATAGWPG